MILLTLVMAFTAHASPDRIGNGGGIWTCFDDNKEIQSAVLVDLFEAEAQSPWHLIRPSNPEPMQIVDLVRGTARQRFPDYISSWDRVLGEVKARFHLFDGKLRNIEDSLYKGSPPPSLCRKDWEYVQFANYDDRMNVVQVRKDFWESNRISALDKAGLVWHEAIYRWMREEFSEENSVRARQIVGILFSTLTDEQARNALKEVLQQGEITPTPDHPVFVCMLRNGVSNQFFVDYGPNEMVAKNQTVKSCQVADEHLSIHCDYDLRCDSFTSMKQAYTCSVTEGIHHHSYTETGRSMVEAEGKARRACTLANPQMANQCYQLACQ